MLGDDMNGVEPEVILLLLVSLVIWSKDSLTKIGVAVAQRSASQSSRYLDTKPGEEVKEHNLDIAGVVDSSELGLVIGVIAVNV